jgi:hypothetical protein
VVPDLSWEWNGQKFKLRWRRSDRGTDWADVAEWDDPMPAASRLYVVVEGRDGEHPRPDVGDPAVRPGEQTG